MKRFLLALAAFSGIGRPSDLPADTVRKPNIVYILADDLGWTDLGCQGSAYYETPNIDRLAAGGIRLTNYHNCQNCQPTRAALLSGQYAARTGVYTVGGVERFDWQSRPLRPVDNQLKLPLGKVTIAQRLKSAGYATALFGKWHLGEGGDYHPQKRGFDEAVVSMGLHFDFETHPKVPVKKGEYLADFLTDRAVDFIERHKDTPFFLYVPHFGVHAPHHAKAEWIAHFQKKTPRGGHQNPVYAAMIASVDESVGRILAALDRLHLADNTIVIFSSDNGGVGGYRREGGLIHTGAGEVKGAQAQSQEVTDNAPLRSGKGSLYEGGTRVPFVVRWPGVTPPGSVCSTPAIHVDVYPTFLQMAGATAPENQPLDGESLVALLKDPSASLQRTAIFQHFPGYLGQGKNLWRTTPVGVIQSGDWKLMEYFEDRHLELYDLKADLSERRNLAEEMPEKARELHARMVAWREQIRAPMPGPNTAQGPADAERRGASKGAARGAGRKQAAPQ
jgi:arylsulfatase A-like enzyme